MDWDDLKIVLAIARHGSITAAAKALGTTQPTVSRRLDAFEKRLKVKLFERNSVGLALTNLGSALLDDLSRMEENALAIERRVASHDASLEGAIVITSLDWLGDYLISPVAAQFAVRHPLVDVELLNDTRPYSLSRREADIAFRFGSFEQENLILRKVAEATYGLYASQAYIAQFGLPGFEFGCKGHTVASLYNHASHVSYTSWLKRLAPNARVALRSNGLSSHLSIAENGIAMVVLPRFIGDQRRTLQHIAVPLPEPQQAIYLGVHPDMRDAPRIRAFIDFAVGEFRALIDVLNPSDGGG
ncbi:LysR family transcriptional regulator [Microvirga sp. GCM10011540]|uniref:LysR family transcriptional regulator n=1 Tax=Microvirga sp. GCM10011540 TaxID=3317338 RepID=UPI0036181D2E